MHQDALTQESRAARYRPSVAVSAMLSGYLRQTGMDQNGYVLAIVDALLAESGMSTETAIQWVAEELQEIYANRG